MNRADAIRFIDDLLADQHADAWGDRLPDSAPAVAELVDLDAVASRVFEVHDDGQHVLQEWASLAQIMAVAEQHQRPQLPTVGAAGLPCPPWCERPDGHPFEAYVNGNRRDHIHRFSDRGACVWLEQIERSPDPATGLTDLGIDPAATVIGVQLGPGVVRHLSGTGARRLAAQLLDAATLCESVEGE